MLPAGRIEPEGIGQQLGQYEAFGLPVTALPPERGLRRELPPDLQAASTGMGPGGGRKPEVERTDVCLPRRSGGRESHLLGTDGQTGDGIELNRDAGMAAACRPRQRSRASRRGRKRPVCQSARRCEPFAVLRRHRSLSHGRPFPGARGSSGAAGAAVSRAPGRAANDSRQARTSAQVWGSIRVARRRAAPCRPRR